MDEQSFGRRKTASGRKWPATVVLLLAATVMLHWAGLAQGVAAASQEFPSVVAGAPDLSPDPHTNDQIIDLRDLVRLGLIESRLLKSKPTPPITDSDDPAGLDPRTVSLPLPGRPAVASSLPPPDPISAADADFAARAPPARSS